MFIYILVAGAETVSHFIHLRGSEWLYRHVDTLFSQDICHSNDGLPGCAKESSSLDRYTLAGGAIAYACRSGGVAIHRCYIEGSVEVCEE